MTDLTPDRPIWATAMYAGLRRGELMALAAEDVDLAQGVLHVRRSWDHKQGFIPTKNRKERRVPIPAVLRDYLDEHLLRLGSRGGLVFGESPVRPFKPDTARRHANRIWKKAGLAQIGLHECRHTFASLMIAAGVNAKALQSYMGRSSIQVKFDLYGKLMPGNEDEAARPLDAYLACEYERARLAAGLLGGQGDRAVDVSEAVTQATCIAACLPPSRTFSAGLEQLGFGQPKVQAVGCPPGG